MTDNEEKRESPDMLIALWLGELPLRRVGGWRGDVRYTNFVDLVATFKQNNYSRREVESFFENKILHFCVNDNYPQKILKKWKEQAKIDYLRAIGANYDVVKPVHVEKTEKELEKIRIETALLEAEALNPKRAIPKVIGDIDSQAVESATGESLILPNTLVNPLDRSIFKDEPEFEVLRDEEFDKLLGIKDE